MPSMRAIAKELGISHPYLSRLLNGQRQWTPELYEKYNQLSLGTMVPTLEEKSSVLDMDSPENLARHARGHWFESSTAHHFCNLPGHPSTRART